MAVNQLAAQPTAEVTEVPEVAVRRRPRGESWSVEATSTLINAWGSRYLRVNRGNLQSKDWEEVTEVVNRLHGQTNKTFRTEKQCKDRIDTVKKKFKAEKAKVAESNGTITSSWPLFSQFEVFVGADSSKQRVRARPGATRVVSMETTSVSVQLPPLAVPLTSNQYVPSSAVYKPVILPQKRPLSLLTVDDSNLNNNYSAIAPVVAAELEPERNNSATAAAAAASVEVAAEVDVEERGSESSDSDEIEVIDLTSDKEEEEGDEGVRGLSKAIERFGERYERVEVNKQNQMMELEKQRMNFIKDLEVQRMKLLMDTVVQLEKIKQAKESGSSDA